MTTNATINIIINIGLAVLLLIVVCVAFYFYILGKVYKEGAGAINDAEQDDKEGKEKLEFAVSRIYEAIPAFFHPIITRTVISGIVQMLFDKIEAYARKQAGKYLKNTEAAATENADAETDENTDTSTDDDADEPPEKLEEPKINE